MSTWLLTLLCQLCLLHPRSCLLLLACLPMLIALAQSSGRSRLGEQEEGPHQRGALLSDWLVLLCCKPHLEGYLFCIIIIICSNCLNCLFKKEGIHRAISAVCGITWGLHIWSSPAHLLFRILIQACLFHNSELLFLYYFYPLPSFFPLYIACPVQQMWGSDPTSIEVNSQIPIDFAESESESVWGVRIRAK